MRRSIPRHLTALVLLVPPPLLLALSACGLDRGGLMAMEGAGGDDASVTEGDTSVPITADGGTPVGSMDGGSPVGPLDGGKTADSAPLIIDGCATVETCDNGIDDNCDGLVDCADPQCGAWSCIEGPLPGGWSVVDLSNKAPAGCAESYSGATSFYAGTFPAAQCSCASAVGAHGSCASGNVSVGAGLNCTEFDAGGPGQRGACGALPEPFTPPVGSLISVTAAPYTPGTCTATPTTTVPPASPTGQTCVFPQAGGGGCTTSGGTCVPVVPGSDKRCIMHAGASVPCPPAIGFDNPQTVNQGIDDTRDCTDCTPIGPTATCANPELTFYTDPMCGDGGSVAVSATGACVLFPAPTGVGAPTYAAERYTAIVQGETCTASAVTPTGGVTLSDPVTICCP